MTLESLRGFLQLGFMVSICGLLSALMQPNRSSTNGAFVLSVCSAVMGATLIGGSILLTQVIKRAVFAETDSETETEPDETYNADKGS
ncbi:MAG: hypothetical protein KF726_18675 [Anaerolineae bacterium]|nr:hypothetical protein [Anaerolineae bacterium]